MKFLSFAVNWYAPKYLNSFRILTVFFREIWKYTCLVIFLQNTFTKVHYRVCWKVLGWPNGDFSKNSEVWSFFQKLVKLRIFQDSFVNLFLPVDIKNIFNKTIFIEYMEELVNKYLTLRFHKEYSWEEKDY